MRVEDIKFSTDDLNSMIRLMRHYKEFPMPLCCKNDVDENMIISINKDNIVVKTIQNNGWARTNIFYKDGTVEELYER